MKLVCLGGAGAMASSALYDLYKTSTFSDMVIADADEAKARRIMALMDGDKRFSFVPLDAARKNEIVKVIRGADYVLDGLPDQFIFNFMDAVAEVGVSGVSFNDIGIEESAKRTYDSSVIEKTGATLSHYSAALEDSGCAVLLDNGGSTITSLMAILGCEQLDEVEEINEYWSLWRPVTQASPGLVDAAIVQFDPRSRDRIYWERGEYIRGLPPFALLKEWDFPQPIGRQLTYMLEHKEPVIPLIPIVRQKGAKRVVVRGAFHPQWTRLAMVLVENGIFEAEPIELQGVKVSPYEVVMKHIERHAEEKWEDSNVIAQELGFVPRDILSTEVIGSKSGIGRRIVYHCIPPFPFFEGKPVTASMEYGSFVGVTCSIALQMLARGEIRDKGAFIIQTTDISAAAVLKEYEKRGFTLQQEPSFPV
ncbi:MAG: saccharopine dehydrogenase NADP-binding domain-containing protein [Spirochaetaceae bacterium]|nr:MAG: saccharopine dehydrogenase NADP-binding domain-containing protein [Spirochaetaceae bacterium]